MSCASCSTDIDTFGANPTNLQWIVVRGDTASLRIEFYQPDEVTGYNTVDWTYLATAYSPKTKQSWVLSVVPGVGYADVVILASISYHWSSGFSDVPAELLFDLQVTIPAENINDEDTVWTPVIGSISVIADVTAGAIS